MKFNCIGMYDIVVQCIHSLKPHDSYQQNYVNLWKLGFFLSKLSIDGFNIVIDIFIVSDGQEFSCWLKTFHIFCPTT